MTESLVDEVTNINITAIARYLRDLQIETFLSNSEDNPDAVQYKGALQQAQRPDMHAMTVHDHMITVGTLASDVLNIDIANPKNSEILPGEVYEVFGLNAEYLKRLTKPDSRGITEEAEFRRDLYLRFKRTIARKPLTYEDRFLGVTISYLHDYEKIFSEELNSTVEDNGKFRKVGKFTNVAYGLIDPNSQDEVDSQSKLTLNLFRELAKEGFMPDRLSERLVLIYKKYLDLTNYVKGSDSLQPAIDIQDKDQLLALVLLFSDELGKGIQFEDNRSESVNLRRDKMKNLEILLEPLTQ